MQSQLTIVPVELSEANQFVETHHRHHYPVVGHRFSIGVIDEDNRLRGVAIIGRPVARLIDHRRVLEVTRLATDGCPNACSALYAAAARAGKAMGYERIQTYILDSETGITLKAAGWYCEASVPGQRWDKHSGDDIHRRTDQDMGKKKRWSRWLNQPFGAIEIDQPQSDIMQLGLFG